MRKKKKKRNIKKDTQIPFAGRTIDTGHKWPGKSAKEENNKKLQNEQIADKLAHRSQSPL